MADHPLRPATDRCLGGPLPRQLANQTQDPLLAPGLTVPGFHHRHPSRWSHAVLPFLSERYSPQRGRFPTRYSPVCHAPIAGHIRLACVRHAASVHSEPGSNSHVQSLRSSPTSRPVWLSSLLGRPRLSTWPTQRLLFSLSDFQRRPDYTHMLASARPQMLQLQPLGPRCLSASASTSIGQMTSLHLPPTDARENRRGVADSLNAAEICSPTCLISTFITTIKSAT